MIATQAAAKHNHFMAEHGDSYASEFTGHDRRRLRLAMRQAASARLFRRLQALLRVAEGASVAEAAAGAGVDRSTVHRWVERYQQHHYIEDLADVPSPGRPFQAKELDESLLAQVLAEDPREHGLLATTWTVPLLAAHLDQAYGCVVSERTLRRRLHEYGWRWKRPRYVYHERARHIAQKKGRLCAA
jgi:transposase